MARPKMHPKETRSVRFNLRFTADERHRVDALARVAGLPPHEYCRRRCLEYEVRSALHDRVDPRLVTRLNELGLELNAVGNNANQIARSKHTGRRERVAWQGVVEAILALNEEISAVLEKALVVSELNQLGLDLGAIRSSARTLARAAEEGTAPQIAWQDVVAQINAHGGEITAAVNRLVPKDDAESHD